MLTLCKVIVRWLLCFLIISQSTTAAAQTSLLYETGNDNSNGKNHYLSAQHNISEDTSITFSTGKSTRVDATNFKLKSESSALGIYSRLTDIFSFGLDLNQSNQINAIKTDASIFTMEINTQNWSILISPDTKTINVKTKLNRRINIKSDGLTSGLTFYGWDPAYISYTNTNNSYSQKLQNLNSRINLFIAILGESTLNQVFSLEDNRRTIEMGYYFDSASIALSQSNGISAVDKSVSNVKKLNVRVNLNQQWVLSISVGTSKISTSADSTKFTSASLKYRW